MNARNRLLISLCVCAAVTALIATLTTHAATALVQTELTVYSPNTYVNVIGSGWPANQTVQLKFTETVTPAGGITMSPFTTSAIADVQGKIANHDFLTHQTDVGGTFQVTATQGTVTTTTTFTVNRLGIFEIDGNAKTDSSTIDANTGLRTSHDWEQVYHDCMKIYGSAKCDPSGTVNPTWTGNEAGTGAIQFTSDLVNSGLDDTFSNSPKDTLDISAWQWGRKAVSAPKTDLQHGFAAAYPDTNGHKLLYVGTDRFSSGSNSAISIWFLQHPIGAVNGIFVNKAACTAPGTLSTCQQETHAVGDLLIQGNLGSTVSVTAYQWIGGANPLQPIALGAAEIHAINTAIVSVPWTFTDAAGSTGQPQAQEFFEVGIDLNAAFATLGINTPPDFSSFIITTRTSTSQTATLSDFILGNVSSAPDVAVTKTADAATSNTYQQVGYTVTITNVGVGDAIGATLSDPLPAGGGSLNWTFAANGNPGNVFQITGTAGHQSLSFVTPQTILFNSSPLIAHVIATPTNSDAGILTNTATVRANGDEAGGNFSSNNSATAKITVNFVNGQPVAYANSVVTNEDTPKSITLTGDDGDPIVQTLTFAIVDGPSHGTLSGFNPATGAVTYTPAADYNGPDSFTFKVNDGTANSNTATVSITVNPVNDAPVALSDNASTNEDTAVTIPVLNNDRDVDGDPLTAVRLSDPAHGTVMLNADGTFTYTPAANFNGGDSFTYKACDNGTPSLCSDAMTVTITIKPVNDAPVAKDGSLTTSEDTAAAGALQATDTDGDTLTYTLVSTANAHGVVTITNNHTGAYSYTPAANYNGSASFSFKVNDGTADSNVATISMTVTPVNDAPVAQNGSLTTNEDQPATGSLAATDVDGDALIYSVVNTGAAHGTVVVTNAATGAYSYAPDKDYNGPASFTFKANDGAVDSNVATISITVISVNDVPVAAGDTAIVNENTTANLIDVLANDTDADNVMAPLNAGLTVIAAGPAGHGTVTFTASGVTYTPTANYFGPDSFTYTISDGNGGTNTATVSITVSLVKFRPTIGRAMSWVLHDSMTLSGIQSGPDAGSATVTFKLYGPDDAQCSGTPINGNGSGESATIDGQGFAKTTDGFTVRQADIDALKLQNLPGTYRWIVSYSGDAYNEPAATKCGDETHTITVGEPAPPQ